MKKLINFIILGILLLTIVSADRYPYINSSKTSQDVTELFCYDNVVTNGFFGFFIVWGFFFVVLIASLFAQFRFSGRIKLDISLLASSVVTFGWNLIVSQKSCLSNTINFFFLIGIAILSFLWVVLSQD